MQILHESEIISHSFSISPPWYRSIIAYFLYIIFLGLSVWIVGKIQAKRSLSKAENERRERGFRGGKTNSGKYACLKRFLEVLRV